MNPRQMVKPCVTSLTCEMGIIIISAYFIEQALKGWCVLETMGGLARTQITDLTPTDSDFVGPAEA